MLSNKKFLLIRSGIGFLVLLFTVFSDQLTKKIANHYANDLGIMDIDWIKNILSFKYLHNEGAAFSMLEGKRAFFLTITLILMLAMLVLLIRMPATKKYNALYFCIVVLTGGAFGNYIDRKIYGYVVDFIYFSPINFPVFNVADIYVTLSVIVLMILLLFVYKDDDLKEIKDSLLFKKNSK